MLSRLPKKPSKVVSTEFSDFFNNAKSAERKKVFEKVLAVASEQQEEVLAAYTLQKSQ